MRPGRGNNMDERTKRHLREWIERHSPADEDDWDSVQGDIEKLVEEDPTYYLGQGWPRVYNLAINREKNY